MSPGLCNCHGGTNCCIYRRGALPEGDKGVGSDPALVVEAVGAVHAPSGSASFVVHFDRCDHKAYIPADEYGDGSAWCQGCGMFREYDVGRAIRENEIDYEATA